MSDWTTQAIKRNLRGLGWTKYWNSREGTKAICAGLNETDIDPERGHENTRNVEQREKQAQCLGSAKSQWGQKTRSKKRNFKEVKKNDEEQKESRKWKQKDGRRL